MKTIIKLFAVVLGWAAANVSASADNYTTYLTAERGFTEVSAIDDIIDDGNYYYILASAENTSLIVGIGRYEAKPDWAGNDTKALRYRRFNAPMTEMSNFFTIEKDGDYIGFRNVVDNSDLFQTHDNAGYMYVNTHTNKILDDWSYLTPTFQNGYWLFESGKYPISSGNWASGYLGPWNKTVAAGEPIALNRQNEEGDLAGHYRLFRIAKNDLMALKRTSLYLATPNAPIDATWFIVNPSFETGDMTGWVMQDYNCNEGTEEIKVCDYGMTNKDGLYLMNAHQWWASNLSVSQTVEFVPCGEYELSGVLASWEGRPITLSGNSNTSTIAGKGDGTGIPVCTSVTVGKDGKLVINARCTTDWWTEGRVQSMNEDRSFFKLDDVQLKCKQLYLDGMSMCLPNNEIAMLTPNQWYYYDVTLGAEYVLIGPLDGLVYSTDGDQPLTNVNANIPSRQMTLAAGRIYFKTTRSDATLFVTPLYTVNEGTFTAVALNVDGLPNKILFVELNNDGPGQEGTKKISKYLASKNYDIIGCSEDFNYNGSLMESLNDNYSCGTIRNTLSVGGVLSGGWPIDTDGLNLLWKNSKISAKNESWTRWNTTSDTDGNQYVRKGFRHYDVTIDGSALIDVFILHMDAGDNSDAINSRHAQWSQLAGAINESDATRPKLVIGDTNSRWTREDITANFMNCLNANLTASDVWVEFARNGVYPTTDMADLTNGSDPTNYSNYEIVDKIIYINPKAANTLQLVPQSFKIEQDYTYEDGTTPLGDHKPVVVEFKWIKSGEALNMPVTLKDNADNTTTINNVSGVVADVTLSGRTLYKDNSWNTICLPFNMTAEQVNEQLAPDALMELDTQDKWAMVNGEWQTSNDGHVTGVEESTLYLHFKNATAITAGTPYLIKWSGDNDLVSPTFRTVTVSGSSTAGSVSSTDQKVTFQGTYAPVPLANGDKTNLFLGADNTLKWPNVDNYSVNAFRAYFHLNGGVSLSRYIMNIGADETSSVTDLTLQRPDNRGTLYDLQGRCLSSSDTRPLKKGLYIKDNRKIIIK